MTPNQTALLHRILDHPRVKAYGEGRGWMDGSAITQIATGPTRTLAVIAALGRALNIGDTE